MYQAEHFFQIPSREYRVIWSRTRYVGVGAVSKGECSKSFPTKSRFTSFQVTLRAFPCTTVLDTDQVVIEATQRGLPLVARTEIWDDQRSIRAIIEYPVKTMNIHPERNRFQVDTAPVLLPDLSSAARERSEWFSLAHVVYNTFDQAEFIVREPTSLLTDGQHLCLVPQYSGIRVHPARNTTLCSGDLQSPPSR